MYFEYILHWIAPLALEMRIIICFAQTRDCHVLFFRAQNKKIYNFISGFFDKDFLRMSNLDWRRFTFFSSVQATTVPSVVPQSCEGNCYPLSIPF